MTESLTPRQKAVLDHLVNCHRQGGVLPTVREVAAHFGFASVNAAADHLAALERKGYMVRRPGAARALELAPEFLEPERGLPILGQVSAGAPLLAVEHLDGYLEMDTLYGPGGHYALRIRGDSMVDAGLWDGDYAIVREQPRVENGEIGVAVVDGEATVKRFRWLAGGGLELVPANPDYAVRRVDPSCEFLCGGKVVGMHRVMR